VRHYNCAFSFVLVSVMSMVNKLPGVGSILQNTVSQNGFKQMNCLSEQATPSRNDATIDSKVVAASFKINDKVVVNCNCRPTVTLEGIILVAICTLVALGFCVPIVVYVADTDDSKLTSTVDIKFTSDCNNTSRQVSETEVHPNLC